MQYISLVLFLMVCQNSPASSSTDAIYEAHTLQSFEEFYPRLYASLEDSGFYVIFDANIGKNLSRNAKKWGEDYNQNKFEEIKSMVICNPYYANQVLNQDYRMMALCPLTVTVIYKEGQSTILFARLTAVAAGSKAEDTLWEVENIIISAIENVL